MPQKKSLGSLVRELPPQRVREYRGATEFLASFIALGK